jgi:hypothetical protein
MEQEDERGARDWRDVLVAIVGVVALLLIGAGAWWMWHRREPVATVEHIRIITKRELAAASPPTEPMDRASTDATRAPAELAKPAAPASDTTTKPSPDEPIHGVVAVARLQWSDATPCAGVTVHLGAAKLVTTGVDHEPRFGPSPPPVTDANGRVEIGGLPPDRVIGLGIDLLGRNEDSPRPFETGHATAAADAIEQLFTYAKLAKLTVELRGLEEMAEKNLKGTLSIARADGFQSDAQKSVPPFTHTFDPVVLGAGYSLHLLVEGREARELAKRLKIVEADQHVAFDCTLPPIESTPLGRLPWSLFTRVRLLHPDQTPITVAQLYEANLSSGDVRVRYGSLTPEKRDAKARSDGMLQLVNESGVDGGLSGRLALREAIPLWIEAELGPLRSRVELEKAEENPRVDFLFDLAPLVVGLTRLSFRAHDEGGRDLTLISVHLQQSPSGERSIALPLESGPTWRMVRPGAYHYQCWAADGGFAEGDVAVPAGSPVTVDVTLAEPGHICGTIAPMPDALRVLVSRTPLDRPRAHHEWWGACFVGPDGNYSLDGVPPGDWRLMLTIVAPDESTTRVEAATVTVKSGVITRHDFVPMSGATKRFRFDFGAAKRAFVHVTDDHGANVVDGAFTPGALVELPVSSLQFAATPEIRDEGNNVHWDTDHWTDGTLAAGEGGATVVRFEFPER